MGHRNSVRPQASKRQRDARKAHPQSTIARAPDVENDPFIRLCPASGKASFHSEQEAQAAVRQARSSGNPFLTVRRAYQCPDCRLWHLTSLTVDQSDEAMFEQRPELATALAAMIGDGVVAFARTGLAEPVLDGSPICIPWSWAQSLRAHRMIAADAATPDGYRQLAITTHGWFCARRLVERRPRSAAAA